MSELSEHIEFNRTFAEQVCERLCAEMFKIGFTEADFKQYPHYEDAKFELIKDPYTGDFNLTCYWYDAHKMRIGRLQFNSDGTFYAKYDVVKNHPKKPQWFVEGVSAWGKADNIKAEAKLLPIPN